jgi:hypothetical protein
LVEFVELERQSGKEGQTHRGGNPSFGEQYLSSPLFTDIAV